MEPMHRRLISFIFAVCLASAAFAQDGSLTKPHQTPRPLARQRIATDRKRALGKKWMDEQRIDNCNVPVGKRGSKPRSSACPHVPSG